MRIAKKLLATILAVLTMMSVCVFSSSAAVAAPEFEVTLVSESNSTVVVRLSLVKGTFNSLDATFATSSAIKECTAINVTNDFKAIATATTNNVTKMISCASASSINAPVSVCDLTFTKKSAVPVKETDFGMVVTACAVTIDSAAGGSTNVDVADDAKVTINFNTFKFIETNVQTNYKKNIKLNYETNYAPEDLTWTSSNEKVATVDENGNVYAAGKGSATITVTSADGAINETCEIEVTYTIIQWIIIIVLFGWIWY